MEVAEVNGEHKKTDPSIVLPSPLMRLRKSCKRKEAPGESRKEARVRVEVRMKERNHKKNTIQIWKTKIWR